MLGRFSTRVPGRGPARARRRSADRWRTGDGGRAAGLPDTPSSSCSAAALASSPSSSARGAEIRSQTGTFACTPRAARARAPRWSAPRRCARQSGRGGAATGSRASRRARPRPRCQHPCRTGTSRDSTWSTRCAAVPHIRRAEQEGHASRHLHECVTTRACRSRRIARRGGVFHVPPVDLGPEPNDVQ